MAQSKSANFFGRISLFFVNSLKDFNKLEGLDKENSAKKASVG